MRSLELGNLAPVIDKISTANMLGNAHSTREMACLVCSLIERETHGISYLF